MKSFCAFGGRCEPRLWPRALRAPTFKPRPLSPSLGSIQLHCSPLKMEETSSFLLLFFLLNDLLLALKLFHPLKPGLVAPLEQRRRVDVRVGVILVVGNLQQHEAGISRGRRQTADAARRGCSSIFCHAMSREAGSLNRR